MGSFNIDTCLEPRAAECEAIGVVEGEHDVERATGKADIAQTQMMELDCRFDQRQWRELCRTARSRAQGEQRSPANIPSWHRRLLVARPGIGRCLRYHRR